jgi:hypothetical protein
MTNQPLLDNGEDMPRQYNSINRVAAEYQEADSKELFAQISMLVYLSITFMIYGVLQIDNLSEDTPLFKCQRLDPIYINITILACCGIFMFAVLCNICAKQELASCSRMITALLVVVLGYVIYFLHFGLQHITRGEPDPLAYFNSTTTADTIEPGAFTVESSCLATYYYQSNYMFALYWFVFYFFTWAAVCICRYVAEEYKNIKMPFIALLLIYSYGALVYTAIFLIIVVRDNTNLSTGLNISAATYIPALVAFHSAQFAVLLFRGQYEWPAYLVFMTVYILKFIFGIILRIYIAETEHQHTRAIVETYMFMDGVWFIIMIINTYAIVRILECARTDPTHDAARSVRYRIVRDTPPRVVRAASPRVVRTDRPKPEPGARPVSTPPALRIILENRTPESISTRPSSNSVRAPYTVLESSVVSSDVEAPANAEAVDAADVISIHSE